MLIHKLQTIDIFALFINFLYHYFPLSSAHLFFFYLYMSFSIIFLLPFYHAEWFHGDAFGLHSENIDKLIGFKCHTCCERAPPVCPHLVVVSTDMSQLAEAQINTVVEGSEEVSNAVPPMSKVHLE